jgi:acyl carrier protein
MTTQSAYVTDTIMDYLNMNFTGDGVNISTSTSLRSIKSLDSIRLLELILFLEEAFAISIADEDVTLENFYSVTTVSEYVAQRGAAS